MVQIRRSRPAPEAVTPADPSEVTASRPLIVSVLAIYLGLVGAAGLAAAAWCLWAPFGAATSEGGFRIGIFIVAVIFCGLCAIAAALLGGGLLGCAYGLWRGRAASADRAVRLCRIFAFFFLGLAGYGLATHLRRGTGVDASDVSAFIGLVVLGAALFAVVPLLRLPSFTRFLSRDE